MGKIIKKTIQTNGTPDATAIAQVKKAYEYPIAPDDDAPAFTCEEMIEMIKATEDLRNSRKKEVVTLRLPVSVINQAKAVGKGYTGFLSRLIENAIKDKDMVAKSL